MTDSCCRRDYLCSATESHLHGIVGLCITYSDPICNPMEANSTRFDNIDLKDEYTIYFHGTPIPGRRARDTGHVFVRWEFDPDNPESFPHLVAAHFVCVEGHTIPCG